MKSLATVGWVALTFVSIVIMARIVKYVEDMHGKDASMYSAFILCGVGSAIVIYIKKKRGIM